MAIATHLIKIKGTFDDKKWTEEQLRCLVHDKIKDEIESIYHPDLELFQVKDKSIEVWVYITNLTLAPLKLGEVITNWFKYHIKEDGLAIDNIEIEKSGNGFYIVTH